MPFEDLDLVERGGRTRLRLRVKPAARRDAVLGVHAGALKVSVTAPPERGMANRAVLSLIADRLRIPASSLALVAGHTSRAKVVEVPLGSAVVARRLVMADEE